MHSSGADVAPLVAGAMFLFAGLIGLLITLLYVLVFCKIFSKAGFSWALGLLILVPIANIIIMFYLAFADWPVLKEVRELKAMRNAP